MSTRVQIPMKPDPVPATVKRPAPFGTLQRKCACGGSGSSGSGSGQPGGDCPECRKKTLQRDARGNNSPPIVPSVVHDVLRSPGQPLDSATRSFMEPRFGHDFSRVRVHADESAAASARAVDARAYTVGQDIVFDTNQYRPHETEGKQLIAHELTHVAQQSGNGNFLGTLRVGPTSDAWEQQADRMAHTLTAEPVGIPAGALANLSHPGVLQRDPPPPNTQKDPKQVYAQALTQLQTLDATIYGYLSKAALNGPSVTVRAYTTTDASTTPPTTIQLTFNLEVKSATLPPGTAADFDGSATALGGAGANRTLTSSMVIKVDPNSTAPLAQNLYHEGVHMLIHMDKFLPTSQHGAGLANYKKVAKANPGFVNLEAELEVYIELDLMNRNLNTPGAAGKDANKLLDDLWEEKYVRDQEKAKFNAPFTNASLAQAYIMQDLGSLGVRANPGDKNLVKIFQDATVILDAIDRQVAATPATPTQTPGAVNPQTPGGGKAQTPPP